MTPEERAKVCYCERVECIAEQIRQAIAAEREECAKIAEDDSISYGYDAFQTRHAIAAAIRARGKEQKE